MKCFCSLLNVLFSCAFFKNKFPKINFDAHVLKLSERVSAAFLNLPTRIRCVF